MAIDLSKFCKLNVVDTCSFWNILSSWRFYRVARNGGLSMCCTEFVVYECLYKKRSKETKEDTELKNRFRKEYDKQEIMACKLDVSDLQAVEVLENRRRLSKGELSSIVFAKKSRQAFLTDDQKARKLALLVLPIGMVQTTPHLFGWLFFCNHLNDCDKDLIIDEHHSFGRPLRKYLEQVYLEALHYRLISLQAGDPSDIASREQQGFRHSED